jgi:hypothetical protein
MENTGTGLILLPMVRIPGAWPRFYISHRTNLLSVSQDRMPVPWLRLLQRLGGHVRWFLNTSLQSPLHCSLHITSGLRPLFSKSLLLPRALDQAVIMLPHCSPKSNNQLNVQEQTQRRQEHILTPKDPSEPSALHPRKRLELPTSPPVNLKGSLSGVGRHRSEIGDHYPKINPALRVPARHGSFHPCPTRTHGALLHILVTM